MPPSPNAQRERCLLCQAFTLISLTGANEYKHHSSIAFLQGSAENGCRCCNFLLHCITTSTSKDDFEKIIQRSNQQIIIRQNGHNKELAPILGNCPGFDELFIGIEKDEFGAVDNITALARVDLFVRKGNRLPVLVKH